jgi:ABC-type lipoprotein export system ATPase subunit
MIAELQHISKYYPAPGKNIPRLVLDDLSFQVSEGTSIAIIGPSGSGKSTLLNILGTLDQASSGIVKIAGKIPDPNSDTELSKIRNQYIGFVFQEHHLLPQLTLLENALLPTLPLRDPSLKKSADDRARALFHQVGLESLIHRHPSQTSIGECQRTAVIRSLINQPKMLLADEPTGSLDEENAFKLVELFLDLQKTLSYSIVMVTHSVELATSLAATYRLSHGKLHQTK